MGNKNEEKPAAQPEPEKVKTADMSFAHKAKTFRCTLIGRFGKVVTAHLPDGREVVFKDGQADIDIEDMEHFSDQTRFAFD